MFSRKKIAMVVAELVGTAVLTSVILSVSRSPLGLPYFVALAAGITMAMIVLMVGPVSGGHANPAVTLALWTVRKINTLEAFVYIAAQFAGAVLAWRLYTYFIDGAVKNIAGKTFDWRVLVAELVGTAIFTFGIGAAAYQGYEGGRKAATIGGALLLGILIASTASNGMLNPAVALGAQSWSKAYVFGPLIGGIVGMNLFALLMAPGESLVVGAKATASRGASTKKTTSRKKTAVRRKR